MTLPRIELHADDDACDALERVLVERLVAYNADATGYFDARSIAGSVRDDAGDVIAGFNGHTWGGCCVVAHLWVHASHRGRGLGRALLASAEAEAARRGCEQLVLSTHSFQAPAFYERVGYVRTAVIEHQPKGHANIVYVKRLVASDSDGSVRP